MAPLLILVFRVQPLVAVGTSLAYMAVTKLIGTREHHRLGNVDYRLATLLAVGSIPGALIGMLLLFLFEDRFGFSGESLVTRSLAVVLVLVGLSLLFVKKMQGRTTILPSINTSLVPPLGAIMGFLVAVTSVGSGSLFLALTVTLYSMPIRRVVGTVVFHGFLLVAVAGLGHAWAGNVDLGILATLLVGSIPGVIIGSRLTSSISERKLKTAVAVLILGSGVRLMF